jgi:type IV pilus assembly protein PilX
MTRLRQTPAPGRTHQRGMTLLVGLMLLLLLTVISTIGFRNTTMSERMTGNSVDRNVAFQSAENAGKEALALISNGLFVAGSQGQYGVPLSQGGTTTYWTRGDGAEASDCTTDTPFRWLASGTVKCAAEVSTKYANDANKAQYVIELLTSVSSGGSTTSTYRVTSRSTGGSGNADVVLQTIFVRTTTP